MQSPSIRRTKIKLEKNAHFVLWTQKGRLYCLSRWTYVCIKSTTSGNFMVLKANFMRRILFPTPTALLANSLFIVLIFIACKKQPDVAAPGSPEEIAEKAGSSPNSLPVVSLRVTITDVGYGITSDGKGDYVNGVDYVQATLDQSGTFAFNTLNSNSPKTIAKRWVNYNFNSPLDPNNIYRPTPDLQHNYHFSTGGSTFGTNPFIPLQNLGINGNPSTECIYMGNSVANSTTVWRVSFHKGNENTADSPTAFAVATRKSTTQWTITPLGSCSPNANVASLRNDDGSVLYGYYYIPFSFTLTKIQ